MHASLFLLLLLGGGSLRLVGLLEVHDVGAMGETEVTQPSRGELAPLDSLPARPHEGSGVKSDEVAALEAAGLRVTLDENDEVVEIRHPSASALTDAEFERMGRLRTLSG